MEIILASSSPRRKEILSKVGYKLEIIPSNYEENVCNLNYSDELIENCAYQKALEVFNRIKSDKLIVGADTVVVLDNIILGKPKDKDEAVEMLEKLSGRTHFVATSICLIEKEIVLRATQKTFVSFRKLNKEDILNYIEKSKPFDKAGSYGIQDAGFDFAYKLDGPMDNVIGFPLELFNHTKSKL